MRVCNISLNLLDICLVTTTDRNFVLLKQNSMYCELIVS